jgi:glycosyltransferase involved in cell wall biosynthesis
MRVSVVIPVYNENSTIKEIVRRIKALKFVYEIILVSGRLFYGWYR